LSPSVKSPAFPLEDSPPKTSGFLYVCCIEDSPDESSGVLLLEPAVKPQYPTPDNTSGVLFCVVLKNNTQEIHQRKSVVSSSSKPQLSHIEARAAAEDPGVEAAQEEEEEDSFVANIKQ
jgi:hypothetical protein